jgi:hypothetical protein
MKSTRLLYSLLYSFVFSAEHQPWGTARQTNHIIRYDVYTRADILYINYSTRRHRGRGRRARLSLYLIIVNIATQCSRDRTTTCWKQNRDAPETLWPRSLYYFYSFAIDKVQLSPTALRGVIRYTRAPYHLCCTKISCAHAAPGAVFRTRRIQMDGCEQ